jgi:hypothetical protein
MCENEECVQCPKAQSRLVGKFIIDLHHGQVIILSFSEVEELEEGPGFFPKPEHPSPPPGYCISKDSPKQMGDGQRSESLERKRVDMGCAAYCSTDSSKWGSDSWRVGDKEKTYQCGVEGFLLFQV